MNKLECGVTSCQHNADHLCCLPGIKVDGPAARESSQTCCDSYQERSKESGQNATGGCPACDTAIECKAEHCVYNRNCVCEADHVHVDCTCGCEDTCGSGENRGKSATECCTFRGE